jgi:hypothetical protein
MTRSTTEAAQQDGQCPREAKETVRTTSSTDGAGVKADDLAGQIAQALLATGYPGLCGVKVAVNGLVVILRGRVASYYMKQMAQVAALPLVRGLEFRNELEVVSSSGSWHWAT